MVPGEPIPDRMSDLLRHLLQQGSYYPLYPAAEGHNIDTALLDRMQMSRYAPNILITPSDYLPFVRRVGDTLCVNPSRVSKGDSGSCAHIVVHPGSNAATLCDNVRVDILSV